MSCIIDSTETPIYVEKILNPFKPVSVFTQLLPAASTFAKFVPIDAENVAAADGGEFS